MIIRRTLAAVLVLAAPAMSGCALQGLDFRADTRLTITAPPDRATVVVPFPLTWTLDDPRPSESGFANRAPHAMRTASRRPSPPAESP